MKALIVCTALALSGCYPEPSVADTVMAEHRAFVIKDMMARKGLTRPQAEAFYIQYRRRTAGTPKVEYETTQREAAIAKAHCVDEPWSSNC